MSVGHTCSGWSGDWVRQHSLLTTVLAWTAGTPSLAATSLVESHWQRQGTSLAQQLQQLSGTGWICAVKGLLQALPAPVQTRPLLWSPTQTAEAVQVRPAGGTA